MYHLVFFRDFYLFKTFDLSFRLGRASSNLYYLLKTYGIRETEDEALMGPIKQLEKVSFVVCQFEGPED